MKNTNLFVSGTYVLNVTEKWPLTNLQCQTVLAVDWPKADGNYFKGKCPAFQRFAFGVAF